MSQYTTADPERFLSHIDAYRREEDLFRDLYQAVDPEEHSVAGLRRHRRHANTKRKRG